MKKTEPTITKVARACADGRHRFYGRDLFDELLPETTMAGLLFLSVTGRLPTAKQVRLLDRVAVVTSVADGRIWPLKLTRIGAAYGSVLAGFAVGQIAIEANTIGMWPAGAAAAQLVEVATLRSALRTRAHVRDVPRWLGFGVPLRPHDERVLALRPYLDQEGWSRGRFFAAHLRLAAAIRKERQLEPNIVSVVAALMLDLGCSPVQAGAIAFFLNVNVFVAHALESATAPAPALRDAGAAIAYQGPPPRLSPRKRARH